MSPSPLYLRTTRIRDFILASGALVLLCPLMVTIGLLVLIDSGRPVLFRQLRVGQDQRIFVILKFRTMRQESSGSSVTTRSDSRVTGIGTYLRKFKLDELPQLMNVLMGQMQIIGPRPDVPEMVATWPSQLSRVVLSTRPGLSDPASLHFRDEADLIPSNADAEDFYTRFIMPTKLELSAEYVVERSHRTDCRLIWQTLVGAVAPRFFCCQCVICLEAEI